MHIFSLYYMKYRPNSPPVFTPLWLSWLCQSASLRFFPSNCTLHPFCSMQNSKPEQIPLQCHFHTCLVSLRLFLHIKLHFRTSAISTECCSKAYGRTSKNIVVLKRCELVVNRKCFNKLYQQNDVEWNRKSSLGPDADVCRVLLERFRVAFLTLSSEEDEGT